MFVGFVTLQKGRGVKPGPLLFLETSVGKDDAGEGQEANDQGDQGDYVSPPEAAFRLVINRGKGALDKSISRGAGFYSFLHPWKRA